MANYSLIINSSFKPFSYAEMLAPVQQATTTHQALEDAYGELDAKASIWDKLANESPDSKARKLYQGYADDLRAQADELAKNGLNPSSRQAMLNMRSRYAKDILPIENAYTRRKELIDEQRKARATDNTIRFDNDFRNVSLDALMENPSLGYETLSGKDIAARTAAIASNYAKSIQNEPEFKSILKSQYWQVRQHSGWTPEQIIMDATGDSNAPEALKQIRRQMHDSIKNSAAYNREWADAYISQGMHSGLGTDTYSTLADQSYVNPLEWAKLAEAKAARRQAAARGDKEDKYKVSRLDRPIKLIVNGADKDEDKYLSKDEAEKAMEGKAVNFENLTSAQKHKVLQTIGQDDPDNYIILTSEETNWFSPNNDVVTLIPKSNVDNTGGDYGNYVGQY